MTFDLVIDDHLTAAENMRRDEHMLERARPIVRLYGWAPEAVSLGRSQTDAAIDLDVVHALGLDVVARSTGGGGILHNQREVTYAVVVPVDHPELPTNLVRSFAYLSSGIVAALRSLGLPAELESMPDLGRDALCYVRVQGTNVMCRGRKISGGAQRRTRSAVLQHGTVIVDRDERRLASVFRADLSTICAKVTSLPLEGIEPGRAELLTALASGFARSLGPLARVDWNEIEDRP